MIYLIDASVYVFRAYYSVPGDMTDREGNPTNAVYGFGRFLIDLLRRTKADRLGVAFDESLDTSFRNEIYPAYKANRETAPEDLLGQFSYCKQFAAALGLTVLASDNYEADDIIGTLVERCQRAGQPAVIVTRDKDLAQLLGPSDQFWDYASDRHYAHHQIAEKFGAAPERFADYLALTGDSVDNIPGVPGVGKKTASAIFAEYRSLDDVYANLDSLHALPIRGAKMLAKKLAAHKEAAYLAKRLTTICRDMPLQEDLSALQRRPPHTETLDALLDTLGFGIIMRKHVKEV